MLDAIARYFRDVRMLDVIVRKGTILLSSTMCRPGLKAACGKLIVLTRFLGLMNSRGQSLWYRIEPFGFQQVAEVIVDEELL
jgi:hypothetical protein